MMKLRCSILFIGLLVAAVFARAEIRPANGAKLNFTQVMFEYNEVPGADQYVLSLHPLDQPGQWITKKTTSLASMVSDLEFGKHYSWHYEALRNNESLFRSPEYSFSIENYYLVDTSLFRTHIDVATDGYFDNDIVFLDYRGIAIDRRGKPVWYYPYHSTNGQADPQSRNLRMTKDGTVTFLTDSTCFEVDLDGRVLWKSPAAGRISGDKTEHYHHDFKKLDDGTYLTASWKYEYEPNLFDKAVRSQVRYNTLIQYDSAGNILWHWNEKDHQSRQFIFGVYSARDTIIAGTHMNAFDYDAAENSIVMSNRHNSSIVKIDKATGNVIYTIGVYDNQKKESGGTPLFLHQHGMEILPDHRLLIYDNNSSEDPNHPPSYPRVIILKQPGKGSPAYIDWIYDCRSDRFPKGITGKGGYATMLPNGNILVCMGGVNYSFEINMKKELVWQASFKKLDNGNWVDFDNYRTNYTSSLHPYYFTLQHGDRTKSNLRFTINNDGSEDDVYLVEIKTASGKLVSMHEIAVGKLSSGNVSVRLKRRFAKADILVTVTRKMSRSQKRTLLFNKPV